MLIMRGLFIMRLHKKIIIQKDIIKTYRDGIRELLSYLRLDKFNRPDNYVNTSDIFLRLGELKQLIDSIELQSGL